MKKRFFYISNAFEESVKLLRSISGDSPAASGKVIRICNAVHQQHGNAIVISLGRKRQTGSLKWYPAMIRRAEGIPIIYAAYFDAPLVNHLVSAYSLFIIMLRITNRKSVLIFYNFLFYYIPTLVINRILGRRCILDLEDGLRSDASSLKEVLTSQSLKVFNAFCNGGAMLASSTLESQITLQPKIICYGVAPSVQTEMDWSTFPLQILFSGSLLYNTGAQLFLDALDILVASKPNIASRIKFVVTGFGDMSSQIQTAAQTDHKALVDFRGTVSSREYYEILEHSHVGLCLKLPDNSMGASTFPSKVVEMSAYGLLVVSTKVSDVPLVFVNDSAALLDTATPHALAKVLIDIADSPEKYREVALRGQRELTSVLSSYRVGTDLLNFWQGSRSASASN